MVFGKPNGVCESHRDSIIQPGVVPQRGKLPRVTDPRLQLLCKSCIIPALAARQNQLDHIYSFDIQSRGRPGFLIGDQTMHDDMNELIPELAEWNDGAGIDLPTWISGIGRYDHALGYASVFWPSFFDYQGCVLRSLPTASDFEKLKQHLGGDLSQAELFLNHLHMVNIFHSPDYQPSRELLLRLGQILKATWTGKLAQDYPGDRFRVYLTTTSSNSEEWELTFCRDRTA